MVRSGPNELPAMVTVISPLCGPSTQGQTRPPTGPWTSCAPRRLRSHPARRWPTADTPPEQDGSDEIRGPVKVAGGRGWAQRGHGHRSLTPGLCASARELTHSGAGSTLPPPAPPPTGRGMSPTTIHVRPTGVTDQTTPGIETRDLARLFRRSPALAGVSVRVEAGRAVAVLGANGAGKTTLLRILATALRPSFGSAAVDGIDVAERPEEIRPRVALLTHATGLYDDLSAVENLDFAAALLRIPGPDREGRGPRRARAGGPRRGTGCAGRPLLGRHAAPLGAGTDPARPPAPRAPRRAVRGPRCGWPDPGRRAARRVARGRDHRAGRDPRRRASGADRRLDAPRQRPAGRGGRRRCHRANRRDGNDRPGAGVRALPAGARP